MSVQYQTLRSIEVANEELDDEQSVIDSIIKDGTPPQSSTARIRRVPEMVMDTEDYKNLYYVPKVVSIGPYHFRNEKLELVQKLKPVFTMKLLLNKENLRSLYKKLGESQVVKELRSFYEENSTTKFCNKVFTKMMLLDSCFILYYILHIYGGKYEDCPELKAHEIVFVYEDLFLLENQIPFKVLKEVMKVLEIDCLSKFMKPFIYGNIFASGKPKRNVINYISIRKDQCCREEYKMELNDNEPDHLLHLLHRTLTKNTKVSMINPSGTKSNYRCTLRNVTELEDVGIHFKPSNMMSLAGVEFFEEKWPWSMANVKLPPMTVDDSTKPMLLNLIAYEMCSHDAHDHAWVTSYICLLDSLIDHPEDVKALRKAGVLDNSLGSDKEVAKLFNEIGTDLVPNSLAYSDAKYKIQMHYDSWSNTLFSQLKHEYVKSPWSFFALIGALIALFLSSVQTYFTVWSPKTECDGLCMLLKKNHHL